MGDYQTIVEQQRRFFASGATRPLSFRLEQLKKLQNTVQLHRQDIIDALEKDLHKPVMESLLTEWMLFVDELKLIINHLHTWMKPQKASTPFPAFWPGKSQIYFEPYGVVLIMGPWNYPFQLIMSPLIGAICAGNCAIIKPSEISSHTQTVLINLINKQFPSDYIVALEGGPDAAEKLLKEKFDYIFFVGSTRVGKVIMRAAAEHLTPLTLELGGKSPCIVDESANLDYAARRIIWGKMINTGQTCLAPDYLYVQANIKDKFIEKLIKVINDFYTNNAENSASYGRIINHHHFARLQKLLSQGNIIYGGHTNASDLYISPTLIDQVNMQDDIMREEIFGPVLPILTFNNIDEVIQNVNTLPKPLALYLFTNNADTKKYIINNMSFGGGCINDCVMQVANFNLPFGGVGMSGMGMYHGRYSFETFSHRKPIYTKKAAFDLNLQYPPYSKRKWWWIKHLMRLP